MATRSLPIPEVGQAVRVRSRLATVRAVEPYDSRSAQGRFHVVDVEYLDDYRYPEAEQLLWEVEVTASILGSTSLPSVDANRPDSPLALQAFVNAHRWTRLNRLREKDGLEDEPFTGAIIGQVSVDLDARNGSAGRGVVQSHLAVRFVRSRVEAGPLDAVGHRRPAVDVSGRREHHAVGRRLCSAAAQAAEVLEVQILDLLRLAVPVVAASKYIYLKS